MKEIRERVKGALRCWLIALLFAIPVSSLLETAVGATLVDPFFRQLNTPQAPWMNHVMERNVTVRSAPWTRSLLPLQVYKGGSVGPKASPRKIQCIDELLECNNLSKTSKFLLAKYGALSDEEKRKLKMKIAAEARASQPLDPTNLHILYCDEHICVTNKPSGILSVPGPRRNPSLADLVHQIVAPSIDIDKMVVHRLDMDTSGILVFALTEGALRRLHLDFRNRRVKKTYQALLVGHFRSASEVEIDLDLERDPFHPPFMRVAQPRPEATNGDSPATIHPSFERFINQAPKPSLTDMTILSLEHLPDRNLPVTRVELTPHTGRTHQLRVHTAALGFPIAGDDIYGYAGEGDCGVDSFNVPEKIQRRIFELNLPLCLHAHQLCFFHPCSGAPMIFECEAPF